MLASSLYHNTILVRMAFLWAIASLLFVLTSTYIPPSMCHVVKGSVSCLDCAANHDLSGIVVSMKCDQMKQPVIATTTHNGSFEANLPPTAIASSNCLARILGAPQKLCAFKKNIVSKIIKKTDSNSYTISTPLAFYTSCPSKTNIPSSPSNPKKFGSSKTVDIPLPPEWGFAPSSYYIPIFPIGIP